nr:MAG TPA: nucleoporin [Caudoviricetes sp.]
MTAEQANAFLSTMGLHMEVPKVEAGYVETKDELMNTITDTQTIDMGNGYVSGSDGGDIKDGSHRYAPPTIRTVSTSWQEPSGKYRTTRIPVYMKDGKPNFTLTRTDGGVLSGPSTSGPKGGGSKPSKTSKTKKSDTVERYKEITDKINNLTRAYDNAAKAADRLYGKDRVKAMEENNKRLKQEIELLKQKAKEAKDYLVEEDRPALDKAASALGVKFKIENDNIINYRQEMEKVYKTLSKMEDKVNSFKNADAQSKYKENTYEPYKDKVDELKAAISQWEETRDLILSLQDE